MNAILKFLPLTFVCQFFTTNVLHAIENAPSQLEMISTAQFVAVVFVDNNNQLKIKNIVKGDPAHATELSKNFKVINYQLAKNVRYLYLITKPKEIHGAKFSVSHFIQVYYKNRIFVKNSLVYWPDLIVKGADYTNCSGVSPK